MISKYLSSADSHSPIQYFFSISQSLYTQVKHSHKLIETSCSKIEPLVSTVATKITSIKPLSLETCLNYTVSSSPLNLSERKEFFKASVTAWVSSKPRNFSEFLESLQKNYKNKWTAQLEQLAQSFYTQSLKYQPKDVLKAVADLLSEGSEHIKSGLEKATKGGVREFIGKLRESLGDKWNENAAEAGKIYKSILKMKDNVMAEEGLVKDWKDKARKSAEVATLMVFAGADELYFWSLNQVGQSYLTIFHDISKVLPFSHSFLSAFQRIKAVQKQDLLELTWPEDLKNSAKPLYSKIGMEKWVDEKWQLLDSNEDGQVTVEDIYAMVSLLVVGSYSSAMEILPFKKYMIKNGEV